MAGKKWEGIWDTEFGELQLYEKNNGIYGDYHDKGFIIGSLARDANGRHFMAGKFSNQAENGSLKFYVNQFNFDIITGSTDRVKASLEGYWTWDKNVTSNTTWSDWSGSRRKDAYPSRLKSLLHVKSNVSNTNGIPVTDYHVKLSYNSFIYQDYTNVGDKLNCYVPPNYGQITLSKSGYKDIVKDINMVQPVTGDVLSLELDIIFEPR